MNRDGDDGLVVVVRAANQAEGEFLVNLLEAEGVAALLRRAPGFDVPDFLAAGPREVLVRASTQALARDVLADRRQRAAITLSPRGRPPAAPRRAGLPDSASQARSDLDSG